MFYGAEIFSFPLHSMPEEQKVPKYDDIIGFSIHATLNKEKQSTYEMV